MTPQPISPAILDENEKAILYGEAGTGKTHAALTAPEPIYFLSVGGLNEAKTYYSKPFQDKHGKKEIYIDGPEENFTTRGIVKNAVGFDRVCDCLDVALDLDLKGEMPWSTLVVDNATVLSAMQAFKSIEISADSARSDSDKSTTYAKFIAKGILIPGDNDYNGMMSLMQQWVSWIFSLDKNVVFIAHEYEQTVQNRKTHSSDVTAVYPQFIGKNRKRIANLFDNVWRFQRNGQLFEARTESQDKPFKIQAKTRIGGILPTNYSDVNLAQAFGKLQAHADSVRR